MHVLEATSAALVRLLIIAAVLSIPVLLVMAGRAGRVWRLVVAELTNSTGDPALDGTTPGLTQLARERIDKEIRLASERRDTLRKALVSAEEDQRDASIAASRPPVKAQGGSPPARIERRIDDSLSQLISAARDVAPKEAQPAVQLLVMLVSRPRGLVVVGIMQRRGGVKAARYGVTFDVLRLDDNKSVASQTFWEPMSGPGDTETSERSPQERLLGLFGPAARWVAIQLVIHTLFPRGARGREKGLDCLLSGLLLAQSAGAFPKYAATFRRRAAEDLIDAAALLPQSPRSLMALADSLDQLAAAADAGQPELYARAHAQYAVAVAAIERMRSPDLRLLQRYRVRQSISWLSSHQLEACQLALSRLADPDIGRPVPASDADLYDLACLYALAAEVTESSEWLETAAQFLVRALAANLPSRTLWDAAGREPQLRLLHGYLDALKAAVTNELVTGQDGIPPTEDVEAIVKRVLSAADE